MYFDQRKNQNLTVRPDMCVSHYLEKELLACYSMLSLNPHKEKADIRFEVDLISAKIKNRNLWQSDNFQRTPVVTNEQHATNHSLSRQGTGTNQKPHINDGR